MSRRNAKKHHIDGENRGFSPPAVGIAFLMILCYTGAAGGWSTRSEKEKNVKLLTSGKEAHPREKERICGGGGAAERQLGTVSAHYEKGGRKAAPREGEADAEISETTKERTAFAVLSFVIQVTQPAVTTEVMWGFTPSYQYRKPSMSTTSPTFRALTASYTSEPGPHR